MLYLIVGPSGSGKNTYIQQKLSKNTELQYAKSYTTRKPRGDEDAYYFVDEDTFMELDLIEKTQVHENWYGFPHLDYTTSDFITDMDYIGATTIKKYLGEDNVQIIYLDVPKDILRERLIRRGDTPDIDKRLCRYEEEQLFRSKADVVLDQNFKKKQLS